MMEKHNILAISALLDYSAIAFANVDAFIDRFIENSKVQRFLATESENQLRTQVQKRKFVLQNTVFSIFETGNLFIARASFIQNNRRVHLLFDFDTETWQNAT